MKKKGRRNAIGMEWRKLFKGYFSWRFIQEFSLRKGMGYSFWEAERHALDATLVSQRR